MEDFPLEPIPAPPAQFNTSLGAMTGVMGAGANMVHDDEVLAGENVALIRSPALKSANGHAAILR